MASEVTQLRLECAGYAYCPTTEAAIKKYDATREGREG